MSTGRLKTPDDRALAVADVREHRPLDLAEARPLEYAAAAAELARATRVGLDVVARAEHGREALLGLDRLNVQTGAEDGRRDVRPVLAVAPAPTARQPVV